MYPLPFHRRRLLSKCEVARTCNLIFIVLDVLKPLNDKRIIEVELEGFGIRLNKKPPNITVKKKDKGGEKCKISKDEDVDQHRRNCYNQYGTID